MDVLMNNYGSRAIELVRGQGAYLYDTDGKEYLDFTAGIAVCNLGHAHPAVAGALAEQAQTLVHCSNLYLIPGQVRLAEKLTALSGLDQAFFCNSGAEANEAAIKLSRRYAWQKGETERTQIVTLPSAFHGRTLGSLSITPKPAYHQGFTPLLPDCLTPPTLADVVDAITERTVACFVEVVQGEGGVNVIDPDLLHAISTRCREVGALLVVDEVQTGVGRTGAFFAFREIGLEPDIVTMAKGLANGVPVGAVLARAEVAAAFTPGSHGSTFGGNPLAMAAANAVVDIVSQPQFLAAVRARGEELSHALTQFGTQVSGKGLMLGITVADAKEFAASALAGGVLVTAIGERRVRFVPPLIIESSHIAELVRRLRDAGL